MITLPAADIGIKITAILFHSLKINL